MFPEQTRALDYLARKGTHADVHKLIAETRAAFSAVEASFDAVDPQKRDAAPAAGKWSPREILDHLVLSHGPAVAQIECLLSGCTDDEAIPADLHRSDADRPPWDELRNELGDVHRRLLAVMASAAETASLDDRIPVEMVIKVDGKPVHWIEPLDWKAYVQGLRVHTLEHQAQLLRDRPLVEL